MSEESTKDISPKYDTKPTIETVLERISALGESMNARIDSLEEKLNSRVDNLEEKLNSRIDSLEEKLNIRLDRIESVVNQTRSEFLTLRADFTELKGALKEHIPALR